MIPLFLIPARGGSRRFPGKNSALLAGIPLVGLAVRRARVAARRLGIERPLVVCSTDDDELARIAREWGADVPSLRPAWLATDETSSVDVALHALELVENAGARPTEVVLVQPTSPLQTPDDIVAALTLHMERGIGTATVSHGHGPGTDYLSLGGVLHSPPGDREAAAVYLNGGCYVISTLALRERREFVTSGVTLGVLTPPERSVDVDQASDLAMAEALLAARSVKPVRVADASIGGEAAFVIAEIGVNHNGQLELARRLVDAAAAAGADAVKFQTFAAVGLAGQGAPLAAYQRDAGETGDQRRMLERLALTAEDHRELQAQATSVGVAFLSSPFDAASTALLDELNVPAFKLGSGELTNHRFLAEVAERGRPMLISTGMSDMREVALAVDAVETTGNTAIVLLHCVSTYPADAADSNLSAMTTMRAAFGHPVGWSDHTTDGATAVAAVAMGAAVIEKHLTLDRKQPGPDHRASVEPDEFAAMVRAIRVTERARGSGVKAPTAGELSTAAVARRSLHWAASLDAGSVLRPDHLVALRPGTGVPPSGEPLILGRRLRRAVSEGAMVSLDDLAEPTAATR